MTHEELRLKAFLTVPVTNTWYGRGLHQDIKFRSVEELADRLRQPSFRWHDCSTDDLRAIRDRLMPDRDRYPELYLKVYGLLTRPVPRMKRAVKSVWFALRDGLSRS